VICLIAVPLPLGKNTFAVQLNNNSNNNKWLDWKLHLWQYRFHFIDNVIMPHIHMEEQPVPQNEAVAVTRAVNVRSTSPCMCCWVAIRQTLRRALSSWDLMESKELLLGKLL
jgi:hypothetical protein